LYTIDKKTRGLVLPLPTKWTSVAEAMVEPSVALFIDDLCSSATCHDFFTRINIDGLHAQVQAEVELQLGYCIQRQSEQDLLLLMRSMWAKHGSTQGIAGTNAKVVAEAVAIIKTNIEMHEVATKYLYKAPDPLDYGQSTSVRGTKLDGRAVPRAS
jgi:hypothetical protein